MTFISFTVCYRNKIIIIIIIIIFYHDNFILHGSQ